MALTKCKECGKEVSKNAESCPHCGAPVKIKSKQYGCGTLILLSVIVVVFFIALFSSNSYKSASKSTSITTSNLRYAHKTINIREGAGKTHKVVGKLKRGDIVDVKKVENKWAQISVGGVNKGYVYEPLLKYNPIQPYEIIYTDTGRNSKVILTPSVQHPESELNRYGNTVCGNNKFCFLWFYSNRNDSKVGAEVMKNGDWSAQTLGMYAIYSRNKIVNKIICYEPSSGC